MSIQRAGWLVVPGAVLGVLVVLLLGLAKSPPRPTPEVVREIANSASGDGARNNGAVQE
jgi:hypothetical protein